MNSLSQDWSCLSMTAGLPREVTAWPVWSPPDSECYSIQRPLSQSNLHLLVDLALFSTSHPSVVWRYPMWYPSGFLWNPGYYWITFVSFWMGSCIFVFFLPMTNISHLPCLVFVGYNPSISPCFSCCQSKDIFSFPLQLLPSINNQVSLSSAF